MTHSAAILPSFTDILYPSACDKMDFQGKLLGDRPLCVFPFGTKPCKPIGCADFLKIKGKVAIVVEIRILRLERIIRFSSFTVKPCPQKVAKFLKTRHLSTMILFSQSNLLLMRFFSASRKGANDFFNLGGKGVNYSLSSLVHGVAIGPNLAISKVPNEINKRIKMERKAGRN